MFVCKVRTSVKIDHTDTSRRTGVEIHNLTLVGLRWAFWLLRSTENPLNIAVNDTTLSRIVIAHAFTQGKHFEQNNYL